MTIEYITGAIGAGKTAYVVGKRLQEEAGREVDVEQPDGSVAKVRRRIVQAGIRALTLEHERLPHKLTGETVKQSDIDAWNAVDEDGEPVHKRLPGEPHREVEASIFNWWIWCRPGDLIVCDEIQYIIPRGTMNKKPPHYIVALEISRHYGVDFIFITQAPELVDTTIRRLVSLHRHVRPVAGPFRMLYEWDHASNTERITNANKSPFRLRREWFRLYKSTVAVVAPPKVGRFKLALVPVLVTALVLGGWGFSRRFMQPANAAVAAAPGVSGAARLARSAPGGMPPGFVDVPKLSGCYSTGEERCSCIDVDGRPVKLAIGMCKLSAAGFDGLVRWEPRKPLPASGPGYGAAAAASAPGLKLPTL